MTFAIVILGACIMVHVCRKEKPLKINNWNPGKYPEGANRL